MKMGTENNEIVRRTLENKVSELIQRINTLLLAAREEIVKKGKKGLVFIMDSLDRIEVALAKKIFYAGGTLLQQLDGHFIYVIPISLLYDTEASPSMRGMNGRRIYVHHQYGTPDSTRCKIQKTICLIFAICDSLEEQEHNVIELSTICTTHGVTIAELNLFQKEPVTNLKTEIQHYLQEHFPDSSDTPLGLQVTGIDFVTL
jgi:hypothetical protein